jgi:hypothetical protein
MEKKRHGPVVWSQGGLLVALTEKRHSDFMIKASEDYGRIGKFPRTIPIDIVLAEADVQSRLDQ